MSNSRQATGEVTPVNMIEQHPYFKFILSRDYAADDLLASELVLTHGHMDHTVPTSHSRWEKLKNKLQSQEHMEPATKLLWQLYIARGMKVALHVDTEAAKTLVRSYGDQLLNSTDASFNISRKHWIFFDEILFAEIKAIQNPSHKLEWMRFIIRSYPFFSPAIIENLADYLCQLNREEIGSRCWAEELFLMIEIADQVVNLTNPEESDLSEKVYRAACHIIESSDVFYKERNNVSTDRIHALYAKIIEIYDGPLFIAALAARQRCRGHKMSLVSAQLAENEKTHSYRIACNILRQKEDDLLLKDVVTQKAPWFIAVKSYGQAHREIVNVIDTLIYLLANNQLEDAVTFSKQCKQFIKDQSLYVNPMVLIAMLAKITGTADTENTLVIYYRALGKGEMMDQLLKESNNWPSHHHPKLYVDLLQLINMSSNQNMEPLVSAVLTQLRPIVSNFENDNDQQWQKDMDEFKQFLRISRVFLGKDHAALKVLDLCHHFFIGKSSNAMVAAVFNLNNEGLDRLTFAFQAIKAIFKDHMLILRHLKCARHELYYAILEKTLGQDFFKTHPPAKFSDLKATKSAISTIDRDSLERLRQQLEFAGTSPFFTYGGVFSIPQTKRNMNKLVDCITATLNGQLDNDDKSSVGTGYSTGSGHGVFSSWFDHDQKVTASISSLATNRDGS